MTSNKHMPHFKNKKIKTLIQAYQPIWALGYTMGVAGWDTEVYMPTAGAMARGTAMGNLSTLIQREILSDKFKRTFEDAKSEKGLTEAEQAMLRKIQRSIDDLEKIPADFLLEIQQATSQAQVAWREAKQKDDFALFQPHLEKLVELTKKKAELVGYEGHIYNAALDDYEEGSRVEQLDAYFSELKDFLIPLLKKIQAKKDYQSTHPFEKVTYDRQKMMELNDKVLEMFLWDKTRLRLDESTHPFTSGLQSTDVRITTWYHDTDFARSIMATIHEYGHAIHSLQSHPEFDMTPLLAGDSLGVDESQSRFWENFVGRSKAFIERILPDIQTLSPELSNATVDDVYEYFNIVRPSLLRVEADEVTYHIHILIRYEIEKSLLSCELEVKDLPEVWNKKYKDYLGVDVSNNANGVLQDIHWAFGSFGYFSTYSTGTVLSATWLEMMEKDVAPIEDLVATNEGIKKVQTWQKNHIHTHGSMYTFNEHVQKETGKTFDLDPWKRYLEEKYL